MSPDIFEAICLELEESWEGLSIICPKHKISRATFYNHKDKSEANLDRYARARERQLDYLEDLLFKISMNDKKDMVVDDKVNLGSNVVARARLQVDTIKFVLGKLRSHVWGQKIEINHTAEPRIFNV
jgi:hypothetical protein